MRKGWLIAAAIGASFIAAHAQTPSSPPPAFDVAAIKQAADPTALSFSMVQPGGRYAGQNMSLRLLIKTAYGVHDSQIFDGPSWIDSDHWDINAKAEGYKDATTFRDQARLMVRPLLADRFKLVLHHEQREIPVYALVLAKANGELGPNFRRNDERDCDKPAPPITPAGGAAEPSAPMPCGADGFNVRHLWARAMTLRYMLIGLSRTSIDRVVVDHTGLTGKFDWEVQWIPDDLRIDAAKRPDGPSIFQAFRDQLGLTHRPRGDRGVRNDARAELRRRGHQAEQIGREQREVRRAAAA
jgi:uncharacterized protein (TIGR03435 family)